MNIELNNKTIELPKLTMKLSKMQEGVEHAEKTSDVIWKKAYDYVKVFIPKADLDVVLDGKNIDEIDLVELNNVYTDIVTIYKNALEAPKMEATRNKIDEMSGAVDTISKVATAANQLGIK